MMRRWWLPLALLLSLGVNLGVVAVLALRREPPVALEPFDGRAAEDVLPEIAEPEEPAAPPVDVAPSPEPAPPDQPSQEPRARIPPRAEPEADRPRPPVLGPRDLPRDQGPGLRFEALARSLRLDAVQTERFLELQRRHFESSRLIRQRLEMARRELARELMTGAADRGRVDDLLREIDSSQSELDRRLSEMMLEAQEFLTPEQQRRFAFFVVQRLRPGPQGPPRGPVRRFLDRRDRPMR